MRLVVIYSQVKRDLGTVVNHHSQYKVSKIISVGSHMNHLLRQLVQSATDRCSIEKITVQDIQFVIDIQILKIFYIYILPAPCSTTFSSEVVKVDRSCGRIVDWCVSFYRGSILIFQFNREYHGRRLKHSNFFRDFSILFVQHLTPVVGSEWADVDTVPCLSRRHTTSSFSC